MVISAAKPKWRFCCYCCSSVKTFTRDSSFPSTGTPLSASHWKTPFVNWPHSALNEISVCRWLAEIARWLWQCLHRSPQLLQTGALRVCACWMWPSPDTDLLWEQHLNIQVFGLVWNWEHTVPTLQLWPILGVESPKNRGELFKCKLCENCKIMKRHSLVWCKTVWFYCINTI